MKDLNMGLESRGDLMRKLDDDTAMHLLQYLDTTKDIASASSVCRSWRSFVREGQLWKGLCLKEFPEVRTFEEDIEEDQSKDLPPAGSCGSSVKPNLERKERIYRDLFRELRNKPMDNKSCIREAVSASSTDNYPEESIVQTLHPRPRYHDEQTPSYWSSTGQRDVNHPETLTYNLVSQLCVVHEVRIRPFKAFFQFGQPIYSAKNVRIRLGHVVKSAKTDCDSGSTKDYVWTYESPIFNMEQVDSMQVFKLPRPVLCVGGILQVELLGRVQTQEMDQLYYICICHVSVVGWPLSDFRARLTGEPPKFCLEYRGRYKESQTGVHGVKQNLVRGETAPEIWMSFAISRVLRRNRIFLNSL